MSSLCPGTLFSFPGFNKKSTPVPPQTTSEQISKRYRREPFNGRPWPQTSPVAGVYDVGFSSTRMILFNNRKKKQSKLRGNNDPKSEESLSPDPNRHYRASSPVSRDLHHNCYNSMSPYYTEPKLIQWMNYSERPPPTYEDGTLVNPKRHTSCCVPTDPLAFRVGVNNDRRPYSRASLPPTFRSSPMLNHPDLKRGEKEYIGSIARIYSAQQMIKLKQKQYNQLLSLEMEKGYHTPEEYNQYKKFIQLGRRRQYSRPSRAMSAPQVRWTKTFEESLKDDDDDYDEKEQTTKKDASPRSKSPVNSKGKQAGRGHSSQSGKRPARPSTRETSRSKTPTKTEASKPEQKDDVASKPTPATSQTEQKEETPATQQTEQKEESSDTSESDQNYSGKNIHREGYDRPLSRLGHIPEDSKSQKSEQETSSNSETETKNKESSVQKSSTEESETQPTSEADTTTKSDQNKESEKPDGNTSTEDTYRTSTDDTTTWSTDRDKTKSDTDTETAPRPLTADDKKTETLAENKPSESDSYTDDFEKDTSETTESSKKPVPQSQERVVSFKKDPDSDSGSSSEDQSPAKRRDSLSDEEDISSRRDPDKLEY